MIRTATFDNRIKYRWVLADVWFCSNDNMEYIKFKLNKEFVMPIRTNRLVAFSRTDANRGQWKQVRVADIKPDQIYQVYLKELPFAVSLVKQVFRNEDGSVGELYLVCSNLTVEADQIKAVYQKRWQIEDYHKSLKSNLSLSKSPTKTIITQSNHFFMSIYSYFKLEMLKTKLKLNHFAIKTKIYLEALKEAMGQLQKLKLAT